MIAVIQRVTHARVTVDDRTVGQIDSGLLALVAIERDDTDEDVRWMADKLAHLRVFRSEDGSKHFDRDVVQIGGGILLVSNFTVAAATRKGRRPSLDGAAAPDAGRAIFQRLVEAVRSSGIPVGTGEFGAHMLVTSTNDGPATFILSTRGG